MKLCPTCGQPMRERRLGCFLSDTQVRVFDAVKRAGVDGIDRTLLKGTMSMGTLRARISQLNDKIVESGYRIVCIDGRFHLTQLVASDTQPAGQHGAAPRN